MSELHGIIAPAVTPFDAGGDIDHGAMAAQVEWLIAAGVTCNSFAASVKLMWRPADSKALSAFKGGIDTGCIIFN